MNEPEPYLERILAVYPDLVIGSATLIAGQGQNNAVLLVNGDTIFRFPLYPAGVARLPRLIQVLRVVARPASLRVPDPLYVALDDPTPGRAFVGYPRVPGEPLTRAAFEALPNESARQSVADSLAIFLRELHTIPAEDVLPDAVGSFDPLAAWDDLYQRIRRRLFGAMRPDACATVARHFEEFLTDPRNQSIQPALVHGDFGPTNLHYDPATSRLTGVIDFDSAHVGDPALDLAAASCYGLDRLAQLYPADEDAVRRVRFYVGTFALQEALFGIESGDAPAYDRGLAAYR